MDKASKISREPGDVLSTACVLASLILHSGCHHEQEKVKIAEWTVGVCGESAYC